MANGAQPVVKISGYLEKKAKLRIGSPWKKYWFVLEGRLLLYYRSKDEYETLSPCKGSINLCPPCNVKPALSAAGVFQIECRASTVTLRAESRSEQERWMQALLAAQSKPSPNRMSHFRYSLDDLPVPATENKVKLQKVTKPDNSLSRQNTMPYRISSSPKKNPKDIIERLQHIGAQTYGGSLETITKLANRDQKSRSTKNSPNPSVKHSSSSLDVAPDEALDDAQKSQSCTPTDKQTFKLSHKPQITERIQSLFVENDQYSTIQEENSMELSLEKESAPSGNTERIKSLIIDNDQYITEDVVKLMEGIENADQPENSQRKTSLILENDQYCPSKEEDESSYIRNKEIRKIEHLYERISSDSNISDYNSAYKNTKESFFKMKQVTANLYERISTSSSNSDTQVKINEQYSVVHKDTREICKKSQKVEKTKILENEYSVPVLFESEETDHNKNSLLIDNDQYIPTADDKSNDNFYSDGLIYTPEYLEYAAIDKTKEQEELYEDPDRLKKQQKERQSLMYQDIEPLLPPRPDLKKGEEETSSQASSNEGKKSKSRFKILTQLVKTDKKCETNGENAKSKTKRRSTSFIQRVWRRKAKSLDSEDDITYEAVDYEFIEKQKAKDQNDIQMLHELQKILETRKNLLQVKLHPNENKGDSTKQTIEPKVQRIVEEREEESLEIRTVEALDEQRPSLPPRQSSQSLSPYHDLPQNNQAVVEVIVSDDAPENNSASISNDDCSSDQLDTSIKTIDEILEDLDKEKDMQESRQKVKQLIEKFEIQNEDEVVLRKKTKLELCKSQSDTTVLQTLKEDILNDKMSRESDELTQLLEELSKVTCAPVLTPGVTSSLVTPVLTDDEWLQLIPIRRRRMSEPDYDVPRPHRSLQLRGRVKQVPENPIPATRFFGPILPSGTNEDNMITTDLSLTSMDPDSLELENLSSTITTTEDYSAKRPNIEQDQSVTSYTSHDYKKDDKVVYAHPKAIMPSTKFPKDNNIYSNINFDNYKNNNKNVKNNIDKVEVNVRTIEVNDSLVELHTKSEEMFIDSLEPLAEISTAF